jgi:hypothetical protein
VDVLLKLLELAAAGGLFGAMLAASEAARVRWFGVAAGAGLAIVSVGRGLMWDWSAVHLMPLAAGAVAGVLAWRRWRAALALLGLVYLGWVAQRGW